MQRQKAKFNIFKMQSLYKLWKIRGGTSTVGYFQCVCVCWCICVHVSFCFLFFEIILIRIYCTDLDLPWDPITNLKSLTSIFFSIKVDTIPSGKTVSLEMYCNLPYRSYCITMHPAMNSNEWTHVALGYKSHAPKAFL